MKQWRLYSCEQGHHWQFLVDENAPEGDSDRVCVYGHEAVMLKLAKTSEYVTVSIVSGAQQLSPVEGKVWHKMDFYVKIECLLDGWMCITNQSYHKEEALALAQLFVGLEKHAASRVWKSKKLGGEGSRIDSN